MLIASLRSHTARLFGVLAIAAAICAPLTAQVPLPAGTYTQTFDAIAGGLPAGWTVTTGASATALGTAAAAPAATISWADSSGAWKNVAAADNTGFTGTESTAIQSAATDRALGIRQTGSFGDPGAAANFNFSTTGVQVTSVSFAANMLSVQARSTVWQLQYGLGAAPAAWTTVATFTDPALFGRTTVTASGWGGALDNQSSVWLRIVALGASTGAGSRDTFGIDDFTIVTAAISGDVAPSVTTQPVAQTVTAGATVQFTVAASGTAPLSYQWRKGTTALADGGSVSGATTTTLTLANVVVADSGNYNVVVTNIAGSATSADAALVVNPVLVAPGIVTQPGPQSVVPGGTATFSVGATGTAPLSYQWRRNAVNLADGGSLSGATTATLTVTGVSAADVGDYSVVVSNGVPPDVTSNAAALTLSAVITPAGRISYTGGTYAQTFDTLPSSGTYTLASEGPLALNAAPINAAGLGGWSFAKYDGTGSLALFLVGAGTSTSGAVYSFGSASAGDRALGLQASGSTISRFGVTLVNSTGLTVTQVTLNYTGEQWRRGGGVVNSLAFEYGLGAADLNNGSFTAAPALNVVAPVTVGSSLALDGNAAANRTAVSATLTGLTWAPGQTLVLRWTDINDSGNDDALAIDDLTLTTPVTPESILPAVIYATPADGLVNVPAASPLSVTFNEAVSLTGSWFALTGSVSGAHTATVSGGPTSYTLTPDVPFSEGETVTLTVLAAEIADQATGTHHPSADFATSFITFSSAPFPIHTIQGSGTASAFAGYPVTVQGVVVANFQTLGQIGGYYLEAPDAAQDANAATSEGIYVFDNTNPVAVGDLVTVTGTVTEYGTAPTTETEISAVTAFTKHSSGVTLPTATAVSLPFAANDAAERYEGMLVTFPQALTVTDNYDYGHFGEVILSHGRLSNPTNVVAPGAPAQALAAANRLNQILLDDGLSTTYPDPTPYLSGSDPATATRRAGSTTTGVTGILDNRFGTYVLEPTMVPTFVDANPRGAAPAPGGRLHVAIGNVLNFFNGDGAGGGFPTARGASNFPEYQRQRAKMIAGITTLAPDIMGLTEVENDGFGPLSAIADIVNGLNAAAPAGTTYAFVDGGAVEITTDLIHVAFIYRTETVETVGAPQMLNHPAFNNVARNPLAQTFREKATGEKLTVCINHFRAKASAAAGVGNADSGDGQGTNNALRVQEANAVTAWLATDPTGSGDPDFLIIGDLNAYAKEDSIAAIESAGYVNLTETFEGIGGYSYSFNGEFGHLDHALGNTALTAQVVGAATWHVNSDEPIYYDYNTENKTAAQLAINAGTPYRYSDHDPVVIGIDLASAPTITTQPVSQTTTVASSVSFTVVATGTPTPTYQWRKAGAPIAGATGASLMIASPIVADAGSYDVVVTNSAGTVTSAAAMLVVNQAVATVTLGDLLQVYSGGPRVATATTVPAGLSVALTYDGSATPPVNAGSYAVNATVVDVNYLGSASGTLQVTPASATITLGALNPIYDGTPKAATITTTPAGLAVAVTYDGGAAVPVNAGTYAVAATITNPNYLGTTLGTLTIARATPGIVWSSVSQVYDGTPKTVTVTTVPTGLPVVLTYNGSATAPTVVGSYALSATIDTPNYHGAATNTLTISAAAATVTLSNLEQRYDGTPRNVTVTTVPAGLATTVTYNGGAAVPVYPGAYAVVATITDPNYSGSSSDVLVVTTTALVRHAPTMNGGLDGSIQVLLPEATTLNGSAWISGDLLMPGTPGVTLNGQPTYGGTIDATGSASPSNYKVTLNGSAVLRHLVRRVNALAMPVVAAPPAPTGTRNVNINNASQSPGDFATLRNLTLNGNVGTVAVPAGTYGAFTTNGGSRFRFGVVGATTPSVYNLQSLTVNGNAQVEIVGPVIINLASGLSLNGNLGTTAHPDWLELNIAAGGVTLNGNVTLAGAVTAPNGTVIINGNSTLTGGAVSDRLTLNGNGLLK